MKTHRSICFLLITLLFALMAEASPTFSYAGLNEGLLGNGAKGRE